LSSVFTEKVSFSQVPFLHPIFIKRSKLNVIST
jgi:hypothetical protein